MDYAKLLSIAFPGAGWALPDVHDFASLIWSPNNDIPKPSEQECVAAFEAAKPEEALRLLRLQRNKLLKDSDFYALPDFPHSSEATRQAWYVYRQALRDLTRTQTTTALQLTSAFELDEGSVTWPAKPG
jgi:hypothetical protein